MIILTLLIAAAPRPAFADAVPGDVIVTLGADLTSSQRQAMLTEMDVDANSARIVTVTNSEEHQYLDHYLSSAEIGSRAISSSKITIGSSGSGLTGSTHNITYVTKDMYINALATAGVKDADIYVTAPFPVSGTAALTGLMKAYEQETGQTIPDATKQVANQEVVTAAQLGSQSGIGQQKAADLITAIKTNMAKDAPKSEADVEQIVKQSADQVGVTLSNADLQKLADLFNKMRNMHINWSQVGDQMQQLKDKVSQLAHSGQASGFFAQVVRAVGNFFIAIGHAIASLFK
ncbi:MAG: DUF1002 domain-containing protein [Sporolactobacillus sp.]